MALRTYGDQAHFRARQYPELRRDDARQSEGRAGEGRPELGRWRPGRAMTVPTDDKFEYRWIREYVRGEMDPTNVTKAFSEGYTVVRIEDLPPGFLVDPDLHGDGYARHGGLLLTRLPKEFAAQRDDYYREKREAALRGVNELQGVAAADGRRGLPVDVQQSRQTTVLKTV